MTSRVRCDAASPRGPSTHSVSVLNVPPASAKTRTGATPPCAAAPGPVDARGGVVERPAGVGEDEDRGDAAVRGRGGVGDLDRVPDPDPVARGVELPAAPSA